MTLRVRVTLFVCLCTALLVAGLTLAGLKMEDVISQRYVDAAVSAQDLSWRRSLDKLTHNLMTSAVPVLQTNLVMMIVDQHDPSQLRSIVQPLVDQLIDNHEVTRVEIADTQGILLYSSRALVSTATLVDAGLIMQAIGQNSRMDTIEANQDGHILATIVLPLNLQGKIVGALIIGHDVDSIISEIKTNSGADIFITDLHGQVAHATNRDLWYHLNAKDKLSSVQAIDRSLGEQMFSITALPLLSTSGATIGREFAVKDITDSNRREAQVRLISLMAVLIFILMVVGILSGYLRRAFRPLDAALSALNSLSQGDISVEVEVSETEDEIGRIARALQIFRDQQLHLRHLSQQRERQRQRQQRYIHRQMMSLVESFPTEERDELLHDLEQVKQAHRQENDTPDALADLAVAFDVMSRRIRQQHARLESLVAELSDALATKTELINLQQQFRIANDMQKAMLPRGFPPRSDIQVAATLQAAKEFGGEFYDYLILEDGRIAVTVGHIEGKGLSAAFFTLKARTMVRVMLLMGCAPADCLTRTNRMLTAENDEGLPISLIIIVFNAKNGHFVWSTAGFPNPLLLRRLGDVVVMPSGNDSDPLGLRYDLDCHEHTADIPVQSTIVLASDGLDKAVNASGGVFSRPAVIGALRMCNDLAAESITSCIMDALNQFIGNTPQEKDAVCLALRYNGDN